MVVQVSPFEQFVRFGTDAYGLERLLRLLQSLTTLLLFSPTLHHLLLLFPLSPFFTTALLAPKTLTPLRKRLATLRQPFRLFRFLDSFASAWSLFSSSPSPPPPPAVKKTAPGQGENAAWKRRSAEHWLDFAAKSFTGVYLLLESLTFIEVALDVPPEIGVWGTQAAVGGLVVDGQRFWFAGLVCGVLGGVLRLVDGNANGNGNGGGGKEKGKVLRRVVADVLDLAIPGSVVGWVRLEPATVGWCMLGSTVLTGWEVWERCGREVAARRAAVGAGR